MFMRCALLAARGNDLADVLPQMARGALALAEMQQETSAFTLGMVRQTALNLRGEAEDNPIDVSGEAYDARTAVAAHRAANDTTNLFCHLVQRQKLAVFYGDGAACVRAAEEAAPMEDAAASTYFIVESVFYEAMGRAMHADSQSTVAKLRTRRTLTKLHGRLDKVRKASAVNVEAMCELLAAERLRLAGKPGDALVGYEKAARLAADRRLRHIEGLALERAGRLQLFLGNRRTAETHLMGARLAYDQWGATGVVDRLVDEFPAAAPRSVGDTRYNDDDLDNPRRRFARSGGCDARLTSDLRADRCPRAASRRRCASSFRARAPSGESSS